MIVLHIENEDFDSTTGLSYDRNKSNGNICNHTYDIVEKNLVQRVIGENNNWSTPPESTYITKYNKTHLYSFYMISFTDLQIYLKNYTYKKIIKLHSSLCL